MSVRGALLALFAVLNLGQAGCAGFWDEVWSRDFSVKEWWTPPDPMVVLRDSTDGDRRARALHALREPKGIGGTDKEQDMMIEILTTAATTERAALCRLAAIDTMGTFKDPRVVPALKEAYFRATFFAPETATVIRCRALAVLGDVGQPAAVEILASVLKQPPVDKTSSETEKQQQIDERIAAARALGRYKGRLSTDALVAILKTEQNIALRDRANESLQLCTGKEFAPDADLWAKYLDNAGKDQPAGLVEDKGFLPKVLDLVDFR